MCIRWSASAPDSSHASTARGSQETKPITGGSGIIRECSEWNSGAESSVPRWPTPSISMSVAQLERYCVLYKPDGYCCDLWVIEWRFMCVWSSGIRSGSLESSVWGGPWASVRGGEENLEKFSTGRGSQFWRLLSIPGQRWSRQTGQIHTDYFTLCAQSVYYIHSFYYLE